SKMRSLSLLVPAILSLAVRSNAKVDFTYSTLYSIFDFQGIPEVTLPRCQSGCIIYASAVDMSTYEGRVEPYTNNLVIYDQDHNTTQRLAMVATTFNTRTGQKILS
ncbi:hypothetical protein PFISCL1PPCAC_21835, partial [Pristionchus fissidentatus]